ncbi:Uncharacterised protein [Burkholderia pseudomallei]|nr:hypothetical protein [Burkholderia pseudomallei]AHE36203.1 hypothetical protein BBS_4841 [Burkholderia pseudomallei NAU20B-16]KGU68096.1 hypothetical protein Y038_5687 [Burkholderia pseudomallei MSHR543]KGW20585.1 hypothetical protein Y047_4979 [Burkholderia pseudomallei MSHR3016]KGW23481.1 hypothetical protein Y045_5420 [Burkholderia pseudomallei MSHR2451]KGW41745.1 hypothetical protein Y597_5610 [Burkholderia pseudomallei MSHR1000]KGW81789.1 hypothetical protein Y030_4819 [Burkholderia p
MNGVSEPSSVFASGVVAPNSAAARRAVKAAFVRADMGMARAARIDVEK